MLPIDLGHFWPTPMPQAQGPLAAVLLGYAAIAVMPGPNMLMVASVAALRGTRAALPHCLGTASGVAALAAGATLLAASLRSGSLAGELVRVGSALLLLRAAWRIARLPPPGQPDRVAAARTRFVGGFQVAALNPLALDYFAGPAGTAAWPGGSAGGLPLAALAMGAGAVALLVGATVAATFGRCAGWQAVARLHRPVCLATACLLLTISAQLMFNLATGG